MKKQLGDVLTKLKEEYPQARRRDHAGSLGAIEGYGNQRVQR